MAGYVKLVFDPADVGSHCPACRGSLDSFRSLPVVAGGDGQKVALVVCGRCAPPAVLPSRDRLVLGRQLAREILLKREILQAGRCGGNVAPGRDLYRQRRDKRRRQRRAGAIRRRVRRAREKIWYAMRLAGWLATFVGAAAWCQLYGARGHGQKRGWL